MGSCLSSDGGRDGPAPATPTAKRQRKGARKRKVFRSSSFDSKAQQLHRVPGRMFVNGASGIASLFTQQGKKGTNQDAMIVWENFGSRTDTVFCGVFDGHGPYGHIVARNVRDHLPLKLSAHWEVNIGNEECRENSMSTVGSMNSDEIVSVMLEEELNGSADLEEKDRLPEIFTTLKESFLKAFKVMDKELKLHPNIDCFCSGTTAVTLVKQGQDLVIGNVGDSRAVLGTRDHNDCLIAVQLTVDLKPNLPSEGMDPSQRAKSLLDKARARAEKLNTARLEKQKKAELRKKVAAEEPGTGSTNEPAAVEESSRPQGNDELHLSQEVEVDPPTHSETVSRKRARDSEEVVEDEPARKMASRKKQVVSKGKKRQSEPPHPPNTERALAISPLSARIPTENDTSASDVNTEFHRGSEGGDPHGQRNSGDPFPSVPTEEDIFGHIPDLPEILRDFAEDEVEIIGTSGRANTDPTISFDPVRIRVTRPTRPSSSFRACGPSFSEGSKGSSHVDPREGILVDDPKIAASVIKSALPEEIESRLGRLSRLDLAELLRLQGLSNLFLSHRAASILEEEEESRMSLLTEYIRRNKDLEAEVSRLNTALKKASEEKNLALVGKSKLDAILKQSNEKAQRHLEKELKAKEKISSLEKEIAALNANNSELLKNSKSAESERSFAEKKLSEAKEEVKAVSLEITSLRGVAEFLEKENGELLKQLKDSNSTLVTITSERDALRNNHESISKEVEACRKFLSESKQKVEELEMICSEARQVTKSALEEARDEGREESFPVLKEFVLKFPNADFANLTYIEALEALAGGARDANVEERELGNNDGVTTTFPKGSE